jgi:hypothetical protein
MATTFSLFLHLDCR